MRRNLSNCLKKVKVSTHFPLASSQLEYAATAWSLCTQKRIKDIERVLRRSARFVKGCYDNNIGTNSFIQKKVIALSAKKGKKKHRQYMQFHIKDT